MKRAAGVLAVIAVIALIVVAVHEHIDALSLTEGEVAGKTYVPSWVEMMTITSGDGKSTIVYPVVHPEQFFVTIHGVDQKGEFKSRTVAVPGFVYESVTNGGWFKP